MLALHHYSERVQSGTWKASEDLAAHAISALVERSPQLDPAANDEVWFGDVTGAGEDNPDVARTAVLMAGLPARASDQMPRSRRWASCARRSGKAAR